MQKTFLLGLGAQKTGTTWLYSYLNAHPECATGDIKELAVLDTYFEVSDTPRRQILKINALEDLLKQAKQQIKSGKNVPDAGHKMLTLLDHFASNYDLQYYPSYFTRLLRDAPDAKLVADISPSYSLLKEAHLAETKALLEDAGYKVKALFLMRDPVERCYSAVRMKFSHATGAGRKNTPAPHKNFAESAVQEGQQSRTRYETIVPAIENVFAPEDRIIDYYESFMTDDNIRSLCAFLGISFVSPNLKERINSEPRHDEPSAKQIARVRAFYDQTYQFCAQRTGEEKLAELWPHFRQADPGRRKPFWS